MAEKKEAMPDKKLDSAWRKRARILRGVVLGSVLFFMTIVGILHQYGGAVKPAGVDALCPFGAIESAYGLLTSGKLVSRIAWSSVALLVAVVISAVLFRRSFCGGVCPLGALQEGAGWLGRKLLKKRFVVPKAIDRWARWLKVGVLAFIVVMTARTGILFIRPVDPWATWMHLTSVELFAEFAGGIAVLAVSLVGSFFYERFFCKYLCPMGAVLMPSSRIGLFKIRRDPAVCIDCKACDKACPVNIAVSTAGKVVSAECIDCDRCVNACPAPGALAAEGPGKRVLAPAARVLITLGIFVAVIVVSQAAGLAAFEQTSIEKRAEGLSVEAPATEASGPAEAVGQTGAKPALSAEAIKEFAAGIKGSDTWGGLIDASGIPAERFKERFKVDESKYGEGLKVLAHDPGSGFEMEDVRAFVEEEMLTAAR